MGDFEIFMAKFGKNVGNMGDFQPFSQYLAICIGQPLLHCHFIKKED